jgi:hypothetical protein
MLNHQIMTGDGELAQQGHSKFFTLWARILGRALSSTPLRKHCLPDHSLVVLWCGDFGAGRSRWCFRGVLLGLD